MKATKKIVGAACALVAAVALSAGSTFAWFATNNKVTATGMSVQSTVPTGSLSIVEGYEYDYTKINKNTVAFSSTLTEMNPVKVSATETDSKVDGVQFQVPKVGDDGTITWTTAPTSGSAGTAGELQDAVASFKLDGFTDADNEFDKIKSYALVTNMSLANIGGGDSADVVLNAVVTLNPTADPDGEDLTYKFLKCGFLIDTPTVADGAATAHSLTWVSMCVGETGQEVNFSAANGTWGTAEAPVELLSAMKINTAYTVTFVAWYDGPDADCYVTNALTPAALGISIEYTTEPKA